MQMLKWATIDDDFMRIRKSHLCCYWTKLSIAGFFVIANFLYIQKAQSQVPTMFLLSPDSGFKLNNGLIQIGSNAMIGSNVLDNQFFKKSFFGGHLEDLHLNNLASSAKEQNRAGMQFNGGIDFLNLRDTLFKHPHWGMRVGINTNYHASLSFTRDLFKTIYRGNKIFRNDSAMLGPAAFEYQAWQKFGIGIFNKRNFSSVTLSLVEGQAYRSLIVNQATLYTSQVGDSLAMTYQGDYLRSDTTRSGFANGSGLGVSLDLEYNIPLENHKGMISLSLHDFGFVGWNKSSSLITFDSLTTWQGVQVQDVFQFSNDTLNMPQLRDSVHYNESKRSFFAPLPASVHLRYSRFFNTRDFYEIGISMWPNSSAVPLVYGGVSHFLGDRFLISEKISFGGYARFGLGAEVQWMPCSAWLVRCGTNHIGGWTMNSAHGRDLYFTLAKTF
jgi:hypothetical protein